MRLPLVVGNWKMNTTPAQAEAIARDLVARLRDVHNLEVVLAPPFTSLPAAAGAIQGTPLRLAAQDLHWEDRGPYTGAISHFMLEAVECTYVLVGHSERRIHFGETNHVINRKIHAALRGGLRPILCVGEEEAEKNSGRLREVLIRQIERGLDGVASSSASRLAVAYEPVWAIGTGHAATLQDAAEAHRIVRQALEHLLGEAEAFAVRILYGGSVTSANASGFATHPEVDGVLVGGASLRAEDFAAIVRAGW